MNKIIIDPHYFSEEEYQELKNWLTEKTGADLVEWDCQEISDDEEGKSKDQ